MRAGVLQIQNNIYEFDPKKIGETSFSYKSNDLGNSEKVNVSFKEVLNNKIFQDNTINFSDKASKNLHEINGSLTTDQMNRLELGLGKLKEKGVSSGVLLMDSTAFVLNVKNQTVMTTIGKNRIQENVFSNFDAFAIV
jgi:flagellar operon protein|tara:strand:- start:2571 stop:2984 length:414 start_codon:yes stop_codon:yes gene_type:complete